MPKLEGIERRNGNRTIGPSGGIGTALAIAATITQRAIIIAVSSVHKTHDIVYAARQAFTEGHLLVANR